VSLLFPKAITSSHDHEMIIIIFRAGPLSMMNYSFMTLYFRVVFTFPLLHLFKAIAYYELKFLLIHVKDQSGYFLIHFLDHFA
jgi:hypothetical protein